MPDQHLKAVESYQIPILVYHQLVKKRLPKFNYFVLEKTFFRQMNYLKENNYKTFTFYDILQGKHLDCRQKPIIITFDDGYENNYQYAFPILKHFGFTASIYLVTGVDYNEWDVITNQVPKAPLMTPRQITELVNYGIEFGGHIHMHQTLTQLAPQAVYENLVTNKNIIETLTQRELISMAYPYGALNNVVKKQVALAGYKYALAVKSGPYNFLDDPFEIRRIDINKRTVLPIFKTKTTGYYHRQKFVLKHWIT